MNTAPLGTICSIEGLASIYKSELRRHAVHAWCVFKHADDLGRSPWQQLRVVPPVALDRFLSSLDEGHVACIKELVRQEVNKPYLGPARSCMDTQPVVLVTPPYIVGHIPRPQDPRIQGSIRTAEMMRWVVTHYQDFLEDQVSSTLQSLAIGSPKRLTGCS